MSVLRKGQKGNIKCGKWGLCLIKQKAEAKGEEDFEVNDFYVPFFEVFNFFDVRTRSIWWFC